MTAPHVRPRRGKDLDAGVLQLEISSFGLCLAAEGKSPKTIRTYCEAVQWFAAAHRAGQAARTGWDQVRGQDIQQWMVCLLGRYSSAYASNQYRSLQQFFKWLAAEEDLPDPMAGLRPPKVTDKLVPVFTAAELSALERACAGRGFAQRRDAAVNAVFRATGIVTTPVVTFAEQVEEGLTPRCVRIPPLGIVTSRSGPAARGRGPVAVLAHLARGQPYWSRGRKAIFPSG